MQRPSDRWFLLLWACFAVSIVFFRQVFIGDGVRHVPYIMTHSAPAIGEARWLLFPAFLFALLRPLVLLGIVHTTESALIPFALASVAFSVIYLVALRVWLVEQQIETSRRWIALTAAAVCPAFLVYAANTAEPLFAATFCAVGLAVVARTQRLALGVLFMSLGLLLHQTVFVAFFLLPMATSWSRLRDLRQLRSVALVVASVVTVILGILMVANHISLVETLERIFMVYRNPVHMNWMRGGLLKGVGVTLIGGFPQALVTVRGMRGLREIIAGLRHGDLRCVAMALRLGSGFVLVLAGAVFAYRSRRWEWLVALAGFSILPIVWNNLYGYAKFYVLFSLLVAHVVARVSPRVSVPIVAVLALLNVSALVADLRADSEKVTARNMQYQLASSNTRWITSAWEPDVSYRWPGRWCGMLMSLGKGSTAKTVEAVRAERTGEFMECVREAFCSGQPVWTDDWVAQNAAAIDEVAAFHGLSSRFVEKTLWRGGQDGRSVDTNPLHSLYVYSTQRQSEICNDLGGQPTN